MSHRLIPAPDALANLIQQLADAIPIDGDADRDALFATCGLHPDGSVPHEYGGDSAIFALRCDLSETVSASWTRFQDKFLGVMLFVYSSPDPGSKRRRQATGNCTGTSGKRWGLRSRFRVSRTPRSRSGGLVVFL